MDKDEIVSLVKALDLPAGSFVVFGSCPMAAVGIRKAGDIDLLVTDAIFENLRARGWHTVNKGPKDKPLAWKMYEAHNRWDFSSYKPTLEQLLANPIIVSDVPFANLDEVRKWKLSSGRPKDLQDIALIDAYQKTTI